MSRQARVCQLCGARYETARKDCPLDGAELRDAPDPLAGLTIAGRYVLETQIGAGGMGVVYRARNTSDDTLVALKFLDHMLARSKQNRERFLREAKAAGRIDHEHIIDVMNYGETPDGLIYLVMEYLDGVALNVAIAEGPMPVRRALDIGLQLAEALARAHELDVVHRDIKPENIFLLSGVGGDFVKVLDFGLAQMKGELRLTLTGAVFGTPEYMSPEQCMGEPVTPSTDIYSLGAVLFEMLTATTPFGGNIAQMLEHHVRSTTPVPSSRRGDLPKEIDALIMKMMAKKPSDRHRDAHHVVEEISQLLGRDGGRERKRTVEASISNMGSRTVDIEGAWQKRVEEFRGWIPMAHEGGDAPSWVVTDLDEQSGLADELAFVRRELARINGRLAEREKEDRDLRLRIGRALDELGRDESRLMRDSDDSEKRLVAARERLESADAPLRAAWANVPDMPEGMPKPATVELLREVGHVASMWLEAQRAVASLAREAESRVREREDLVFQIAQLKERLEVAARDSEAEAALAGAEVAKFDRRRKELLDELTSRAEGVYKHFMAVPGFRERVMGRRAAN